MPKQSLSGLLQQSVLISSSQSSTVVFAITTVVCAGTLEGEMVAEAANASSPGVQ